MRALRYAVAVDPKMEKLTFLEDDIVLCKNALTYMARVSMPEDVAFVTWFTYDYNYAWPPFEQSKRHPSSYSTSMLAVRSSRFFILTQACTFPRTTVDRLLTCPQIAENWSKADGHDEMISWALGDALYATHFPILVQHTGGLSSAVLYAQGKTQVENGDPQAGARTSPYFKGVDFDALSLLENQ
jgi:hypothetical protein